MEYLTKVIIDGIEVNENLASATLTDSACSGTMELGATASNMLTVTLINPFKTSFDGDEVLFFVSPIESDQESIKERIENEVGEDETDEGIDEDDAEGEDDDEDGEIMSDLEIMEVSEYDGELISLQTELLEGEDDTIVDEDTDEAEDPEWIQMGVFYVYSQTNGKDSVTLTCFDNFSRMNRVYGGSGTSATFHQHWSALGSELSSIGIELDAFEFTNGSDVLAIKSNTTQRELLGLLCGYAGGYATCDTDGSVGISYYAYTDKILIESELLGITDTSAGEMLVDGIECTDDRGYTIASVGGGQTVSFKNYLVDEQILNDIILPLYRGMRFGGAVLSAPWDDELTSGEFIRVMTEDEYSNYLELQNSTEDTQSDQNALGRVLLISTQTITFGGNATTVINSICDTESAKEKYVMSPTLKQIFEAGQTATNYLTEDESGALVIKRDIDNFNIRIDADSMDIREGDDIVATFGREVFIGKYNQGIHLYSDPMTSSVDIVRGDTLASFSVRPVGNDESDVIIVGHLAPVLVLGEDSVANHGNASAIGKGCVAESSMSHAQNLGTIADNIGMTAIGKYNTAESGVAFAIGNGEETSRSNAFEVDWDGNVTLKGHTSHIGDIAPYYKRSSTISVSTTWKSVGSITLDAGVWLVLAQVSSNDTISTAGTMSANISTTNGEAYAQVTNYHGASRNNRFQLWSVQDLSKRTTVHLNAWSSVSTSLGTNTLIRAIRQI